MLNRLRHSSGAHLSAVTARGQATIPADIRRKAGIAPGDKLLFSIRNGRITVELALPASDTIDKRWNAGQSAMLAEWNHPDEDVYND